ncbi:MAG: divalent-cation tolerance protein CutA [Chloroflexi bacterium]|nr:divalent-cation tolerance protein CutA [Chloroflexota bacterium]
MTDYVLVVISCGSAEEAEALAGALVKESLAACVSLVPSITSFYCWEGQFQRETEWLLLAKTRVALVGDLTARVNELHSYEVPEVIAVPIEAGSQAYLHWVGSNTTSGKLSPC